MKKIFLDPNFFIDLIEGRSEIDIYQFKNQALFVSPLTVYIYFYVYKIKIAYKKFLSFLDFFNLVNLNEEILRNALEEPNNNLEDNIKLHSASFFDCDLFLTTDKKLLKMRFFGKVKIDAILKKIY
jgi:predicted nucleic acid-binding protein